MGGVPSEEEFRSFAETIPTQAPAGYLFLFSEYDLGEINTYMNQLEEVLSDVPLVFTGVIGEDDVPPGKTHFSVLSKIDIR